MGADLPPEEEFDAPPPVENEIVPVDPIEFPVMTLGTAVDKLKADGKQFSVFSNSSTKRLVVLFKREDGTLGLIET